MAMVRDFRDFGFDPRRIERCGRFVGRQVYWKLYAIENLLRLMIHSILSIQIDANWWDVAVDPKIQKRAEDIRRSYIRKPWHTLPGTHDIYYIFLSDLNTIVRANSNLFLPVVPDIDQWMVKIEGVRLPRNVVSHMNFPNRYDRQQIDAVHNQFASLVTQLRNSGLAIQIP